MAPFPSALSISDIRHLVCAVAAVSSCRTRGRIVRYSLRRENKSGMVTWRPRARGSDGARGGVASERRNVAATMNRSVAAMWASPLLILLALLGCAANFANAAEAAGGTAAVPVAEVQITATRVSEAIDYDTRV